ncbi:MAG: ABC transporter permease subunit [Roseovarius sp.]|jgi:ABC-type nitrate/sulfonate/bicarbonate transport system permease component|uniref:ABC transporter permease n=1 Tax=Roseovarius sp. TaxID=1486281 RepID=UPI0032F00C79
MTRLRRMSLPLVGFAMFLLIWEVTGQSLGNALLAPPSSVAHTYVDLLLEGAMLAELFTSLRQMMIGFLLACFIGMPIGVAMGRSRVSDAMFRPWVSMFVVTSTAALIPVLILLLGTGLALRSSVVFLAAVWYIILTTYNGAKGISPSLIATARSFSASRGQIFWKIILPAIYPYLITGARIGLVHAIRAMVMAEMFVIVGYGGLINRTGLDVDTSALLSLLLTLMIVSLLANWTLFQAGRLLAPWYEQRGS